MIFLSNLFVVFFKKLDKSETSSSSSKDRSKKKSTKELGTSILEPKKIR